MKYTKEERKYLCELDPGRLILEDEDFEWIKNNIKIGEVKYDGGYMWGYTPVYLWEQTYNLGCTKDYYDGIHSIFNIKQKRSFIDLVFEHLKVEISFRPPLQLLRLRKLKRILNVK